MTYKFENKSCLLIIDIQEDNKTVHHFNKIKKNITKLIEYARISNILICYVFFINDKYSYWNNFKKELIGDFNDEGLPLEFIMPKKNEEIVFKSSYDSFFETNLDQILKKNKIKTLYVCGVLTGVCVLNSVLTGFNLGYRIVVFENCCSDKNIQRHKDFFYNYTNYLFIKDNI